jgi:cobalt-zinc-cadmium resistance protein CzcA
VGGIVSATVFTLLLLPLAYPWFAARGAAPASARPRHEADADAEHEADALTR